MNTRERILNIAFEAFMENGFESISLNSIIKQSDLTKGAFYHYFKSKDELLSEVIQSYFMKHMKRTSESIMVKEGSTEDKLMFIAKGITTLPKYNREICSEGEEKKIFNLFLAALKKDDALRAQYINENEGILNILKKIFEEGIKKGEIKDTLSAERMANLINTQVKGVLFLWITTNEGNLQYNLTEILSDFYRVIKR